MLRYHALLGIKMLGLCSNRLNARAYLSTLNDPINYINSDIVQWKDYSTLRVASLLVALCLLQWDKKVSAHLRFLWVKRLFWNRNLKMIPLEYNDMLYLILKILNRSLKWGTARLWTPTGSASTSRQSWTFEKNLCFTTKTSGFF